MHCDARELEHESFRIGDDTTIHFAEQLRSCLAQVTAVTVGNGM